MSFLLTCPHCGIREVADFAFGGEVTSRPKETPTFRELNQYNYFRRNVAGVQREWWYHRSGCRTWFYAERDTRTNEVFRVWLPGEGDERPAAATPVETAASPEPPVETAASPKAPVETAAVPEPESPTPVEPTL